jgi:hypothetical protein
MLKKEGIRAMRTASYDVWILNVDAKFKNVTQDLVHTESAWKGITRRDRKTNTWVRSITEVANIAERVKKLARRMDGRWT